MNYIQIIESARKRNKYGVKYIDYTFFKNYKMVCDIKSIKPSKEAGYPNAKHVRQMKYQSDGQMFVNLTYNNDEDWYPLPHNIMLLNRSPENL